MGEDSFRFLLRGEHRKESVLAFLNYALAAYGLWTSTQTKPFTQLIVGEDGADSAKAARCATWFARWRIGLQASAMTSQ
jgi:hypothetical protein